MSRAFTKERDDDPGPKHVIGPRGPYYVTAADAERLPPDDERRTRAQLVEIDRNVVGFGASITVLDERGRATVYTIVNDEDAEPAKRSIGISSPLAQALLDKHAGDTAIWHRPVGDAKIKIEEIRYE